MLQGFLFYNKVFFHISYKSDRWPMKMLKMVLGINDETENLWLLQTVENCFEHLGQNAKNYVNIVFFQ